MPTLPIFAYNLSVMIGPAHLDVDIWNLVSCEMCTLLLCAFWKCTRSSVVDGFIHDQRLRLYKNRTFGIHHHLRPNETEFLEQEGIFHVLEHTSFSFVEGYMAARSILEFDWSVVQGLD